MTNRCGVCGRPVAEEGQSCCDVEPALRKELQKECAPTVYQTPLADDQILKDKHGKTIYYAGGCTSSSLAMGLNHSELEEKIRTMSKETKQETINRLKKELSELEKRNMELWMQYGSELAVYGCNMVVSWLSVL